MRTSVSASAADAMPGDVLHHRDAMDVFLGLSEAWGLNTDQQLTLLGSPARSTFFKWKKERPTLPPDTIERISHLVATYKALQILFTDPDRSDAWLRRPNRAFEGRPALDVLLDGKVADICRVRAYVDAQRGG